MNPKNKIKITHDGRLSPMNAKITDAETGEVLPWVERVEVVLDPREGARAYIYTIAPELDLQAIDAEITPYERTIAQRVADAVMQRIRGEQVHLAVMVEDRLRQQIDAYTAKLNELEAQMKALNPAYCITTKE